jgi:hypothetical protein
MSRFVDTIITYRILKKLVQPIVQTDAYKLGIIDKAGNQIKKDSELNTPELRDAWTMLDRLVFRVRRIMNRQPLEKNRLANLTTALTLVKEHHADEHEYMYLEAEFPLVVPQPELMAEVQEILEGNKLMGFRLFLEDGIANAVGGGFSGQVTPNANPNLAGRDIIQGRMARRKLPQMTGLKPGKTK